MIPVAVRWWLAFVPAAAIAAIYFLVLRPANAEELRLAREKLVAEERSLQTQTAQVDDGQLPKALAAADARRTELAGKKREVLARWSDAMSRAVTVQELSRLLGASGVEVGRSVAELAEEHDNRASPGARQLAARMQAQGGTAPSLWRLDVHCTWPQLWAALERMPELHGFVLPIGIEVAPLGGAESATAGQQRFEVSLWLWI